MADNEIDKSKGFITLEDGTVIQELDDNGNYDDTATGVAQWEYVIDNSKGAEKKEAEKQLAELKD